MDLDLQNIIQVLIVGFLAGVLVFLISFFGYLGYRAGESLINSIFSEPTEIFED
jgi:hypothetical protein